MIVSSNGNLLISNFVLHPRVPQEQCSGSPADNAEGVVDPVMSRAVERNHTVVEGRPRT